MANNKSYFSIFADDFKLMKTELTAEEILDMMSALSDMCMWGETDYIPTTAKQIYFWDKLKLKFDCDTDIYKKKSEAGKIGMHNRWHNKTDNTKDNKTDNTTHNKRDNHLTPNTLTPNSNIIPPVSKDTSPHRVVRFTKPNLDQVIEYCNERNNTVNAEQFMDFYESKGWKVGNQPMKDWKAAVRTWEKREQPKESKPIEYALPKSTTKEEIQKLVEERKREDEETKQRSAEAQRRSDFIKSKGYASVVSLISAGKDVYDKVMAEYRQAQGF